MNNNSVILLFLSTYSERRELKMYTYEGKEYEGEQTNDAPTRYLFDCIRSKGDVVSKVLCIVSREVYESSIDGVSEQTMFGRYTEFVKQIDADTEIVPIFNYSNEKKFVQKDRAVAIYQQIAKQLEQVKNVYVDFTGGMRDTAFLMTTILRYLEFTGVSCEQIVYSNNVENSIESIRYIYDIFQLINGVSEFVTSGNVSQLYTSANVFVKSEIADVLQSIKRFSEAISMCDVGNLGDVLGGLEQSLGAVEQMEDGDIHVEMFKTLIPEIRKHMHMDNTNSLSYPNLILWCVENQMIQQALTIYTEKMPEFYISQSLLPKKIVEDCESSTPKLGQSLETYLFYTKFYDYMRADNEFDRFIENMNAVREQIESEVEQVNSGKNQSVRKKEEILCRWEREIQKRVTNEKKRENKEEWGVWNRIRSIFTTYRKHKKPYIYINDEEKEIEQNDFISFMNSVTKTKSAEKIHYLMYGKGKEYKEAIQNEETYMKKFRSIQTLNEREEFDEEEKRCYRKMMMYYLAVKMIRNHVNHANGIENGTEQDFNMTVKKLEEAGIHISFDFDGVSCLLKEAVAEYVN